MLLFTSITCFFKYLCRAIWHTKISKPTNIAPVAKPAPPTPTNLRVIVSDPASTDNNNIIINYWTNWMKLIYLFLDY